MPKAIELKLSVEQRAELEQMRDRHPKPYIRERAAALLKIAAGHSGREVALRGLYKARHPDTIYKWVRRYKEEGAKGLYIREGRGRKPAFSPSEAGRSKKGDTAYHPAGPARLGTRANTMDIEELVKGEWMAQDQERNWNVAHVKATRNQLQARA